MPDPLSEYVNAIKQQAQIFLGLLLYLGERKHLADRDEIIGWFVSQLCVSTDIVDNNHRWNPIENYPFCFAVSCREQYLESFIERIFPTVYK